MELVEFMEKRKRLTNDCRIGCHSCKLSNLNNGHDLSCEKFIYNLPHVAEQILTIWIEEDEKNVDWSNVPVDTLIEVSEGNDIWKKRYFAEYNNGYVYVWSDGATSHTTTAQESWKYSRLIKEDE